MTNHRKRHIKIIELSNGKVEDDKFVREAGVMITQVSEATPEYKELIKNMNINTDQASYSQCAEFNGRITYLSFLDEEISIKDEFTDKMTNQFGHLSVFNSTQVEILIAGTSVETALEFIAHNEASVARLTSSKTNAQNDPLYTIKYDEEKEFINKITELKDNLNFDDNERSNMLNSGTKSVSFLINMSLKDWHKTLIGRLSKNGVETEMLEICEKIANLLKNRYPLVIKNVEEYYDMGNTKKYEN